MTVSEVLSGLIPGGIVLGVWRLRGALGRPWPMGVRLLALLGMFLLAGLPLRFYGDVPLWMIALIVSVQA